MGNEGRPLGQPRRGNVAGLATAGGFSAPYRMRVVTDARHAGDTATGGGSTQYPAYWDGSAWQQLVPRYAVTASLSGNQTLTTDTLTTIDWDAESYDYGALHDTVTNNSRLTINAKGVWRVSANISFASNATGYRLVRFVKNGTTDLAEEIRNAATPARTALSLVQDLELDASDYVEVEVEQTSGGNLDVSSSFSFFSASLVLPTSDAVAVSLALLETGDKILLENGDNLALE